MKFWTELSARERLIIGYSIPLLMLVVGYLYFWQPMADKLDRLRVEVPQKTAELAWAEHELEKASEWLTSVDSQGNQKPLLTIIESRAIESRIKNEIQRAQPNERQVKLWFQDVVADHWLGFVNRLSLDGISVESATLTRAKDGKINVRVTFARQ
jgi:type II secretory pathway component PulM